METSKVILGEIVMSSNGEEIGAISEILVNEKTGKAEYGILSFGGFMGIGKKLIAAPIDAMIFNEDGNFYELNVDIETLEDANIQIEHNGRSYFLF